MSLAIMSAISLICADASGLSQSLPAAEPAPVRLAMAQEAPVEELTAPPAEEIEDAPVRGEARAELVDEEDYQGPLAFEGESDEAVAERLFTYLEELTTLSGEFTQIAPSGAISSGKFYLRRPGLLRFEYEPPTPLLIVANSGMVYVRDEALETTDSYPVGRTPLKFLLSKKVELDDLAVVAVDRGVDSVAVTLASTEDETEGELSIIVSAPEMTLVRWIVRDLQNGATVVTLSNVKAGERIANRLFRTPDAGGQFLKN